MAHQWDGARRSLAGAAPNRPPQAAVVTQGRTRRRVAATWRAKSHTSTRPRFLSSRLLALKDSLILDLFLICWSAASSPSQLGTWLGLTVSAVN